MSASILDYAQKHFPCPIADAASELNRSVSSHEKRDRIIEVFRTTIRLLCAYAIGVRVQFGEGPSGVSKNLPALLEGLRRRGLTDGQWVSILRELLREYKSQPKQYPVVGMVELFHKKRAQFSKLTNELLDMRKSQTVAHGRVFDEDELLKIIDQRLPQLEIFLEQLKPIFDDFQLCIGNEHLKEDVFVLHGLGSSSGHFPSMTVEENIKNEELCLINPDGKTVVHLHPSILFRSPLPELSKEIFVFEKRGKKGAKLLSLPNMYEIEIEESWTPIEEAFFSGEHIESLPCIEGVERPFRGLETFQPKHEALFFGRDKEVEELTNRIHKNGFVVLTGPSGTGKSSLIQAGVIPQFKDAQLVMMRPGVNPLNTLSNTLCKVVALENQNKLKTSVLNGDQDEIVAMLLDETKTNNHLTVLVVDQGEELVTLCADVKQREDFAAIVAEIGGHSESNLRVVYSLREDFFGPIGVVKHIKNIFSRQVMVMATPTQEELMETLIGPAQLFGYQFENFTVMQEMTETVASEPAALALLQFCADKMWDRRDRHRKYLLYDSYIAIGGVGGALANHAEETLVSLTPTQQEQSRGIFLRLITENKTKRFCSRTELIEGSKNPMAARQLLDSLLSARLLTSRSDNEGEDSQYELAHEALIAHWTRLQDWLISSQESQRTLSSLRNAAQEWEERGKPKTLLWTDELLEELHYFQRHSGIKLTSLEASFAIESNDWAIRNTRIRQIMIASAFTVVVLFAIFMFWEYRTAERLRSFAEEQQKIAIFEKELAETNSKLKEAQSLLSQARLSNAKKQFPEAFALIRAAVGIKKEVHVQDKAWLDIENTLSKYHSDGLGYHGMVFDHQDLVYYSELSKNESKIITASWDHTAKIFDVKTGAELHTLPHDNRVYFASFSRDATKAITASKDKTVAIWDIDTGQRIHSFPYAHSIYFAILNEDGSKFLTTSSDKTASIWDIQTGQIIQSFQHNASVYSAVFNADESQILTASDRTASIWNVRTGTNIQSFQHDKSIYSAVFNADESKVITASWDQTAAIWNIATGQKTHTFPHENRVYSAMLNRDETRLLTASSDNTAVLWNIETGTKIRTLRHNGIVYSAVFNSDESKVLSASNDGSAVMWNIETGEQMYRFRHNDSVLSAHLNADETKILTSSSDHTAVIWDIQTGKKLYSCRHNDSVYSAVFNANNSKILTASRDKTVALWDISTGKQKLQLNHEGPVISAVFNSDETQILTASLDNTVTLWDAKTGYKVQTWTHKNAVYSAQFNKDESKILTATDNNSAIVWKIMLKQKETILDETGSKTNLRVCRNTHRVVAIHPYPAPQSVWAPQRLCEDSL